MQLIIKYLIFKPLQLGFLFLTLLVINSCIEQFTPGPSQDRNLLVVEGLITDRPGHDTIKLSTSMPLGAKSSPNPLSGCVITVSDDIGNVYSASEIFAGTYVMNSPFQGVVGRSYILHIKTNETYHNLSYESSPVRMKPVPAIDSLYYKKVVLSQSSDGFPLTEGCEVYLDTHDPENNCRFYRWEFVETWEIKLPYFVTNRVCWVTKNSDQINIKNTTSLSADRIEGFPINYISNVTDRLNLKYSILVNQYSLNQDEYNYWEKLKNNLENVGSLYDIIPSSTPSNIRCVENPSEPVLGYFSVSAVKSKRIFIKDYFPGMPDLYTDCEDAIAGLNDSIASLNSRVWVIIIVTYPPPGYKVLTYLKGCADCTTRGSAIKPDFWEDSK
jgi:hypothetical protein